MERMYKKEIMRLAPHITRLVAESLIANGTIDPRGKTDQELQREVFTILSRSTKGPIVPIHIAIDYTEELLREARRFAGGKKREMACLFYATWFEHWLNRIVSTAARRKKISEEEILQTIRETPFRGKATWLLRILELKPINHIHLKRMHGIIETRNAFVHYKWKYSDPDDSKWKQRERTVEHMLRDAERTVRYLRRLENEQVYHGRRRKILPSAKKIRMKQA